MELISEIRNKSQILATLVVAVSSMFLLAGYEFVRSASFSLFKAAYGVESLPHIIALTPIGVFTVLWIYGKILTAFGPRKTLAITTLGSSLTIILCYALIHFEVKPATAALFIIRECYAVLLVEQFWSFANSILKSSDAKKYNGLILTISSLGSITGAFLVYLFAKSLGTLQLVLIGGLLCIPCWYVAQIAYRISGYTGHEKNEDTHEKKSFFLGVNLIANHRVLLIITGMVLMSQFYSFFIGLNFQQVIQVHYPNIDEQTAFSGLFFAITSAVSILSQFFLTPFLLARFSIARIHKCIPLMNLVFMLALWLFPGIWAASAAFLIFKVSEYSVFRAAKEILYIPFSFDVRFRAKELIDVFGQRSAQGFISFIFKLMQKLNLVGLAHIPYITTGLLTLWFLILMPLGKELRMQELNKKV